MQRWQGAALAVVLFYGGCIDAQVDDAPGYSRYVLPPGSMVPSPITDDTTSYRKIDVNDGVTKPMVSPKPGWAGGAAVSYWDFGAGKRATTPVYGLKDCSPDQSMKVDHPLIVDSIPGDTDYSPFRAFQVACVTAKYNGEIIPSFDAFNDAIDLGLITDPTGTPAAYWINQPIVTQDVVVLGGVSEPESKQKIGFYRGYSVYYYTLETQEGSFPIDPAMPAITTGNAYEILKPGSTTPVRVIFSQPYLAPDGSRNPRYTPAWLQVTVTLKQPTVTPPGDMAALSAAYDAILAGLTKESDLVTVGMNNALTVVNTSIIASAVVTTNRVNRPFVVRPGGT
jgi:hypothetical protein